MPTKTYEIPAGAYEHLTEKIGKINRRAEKLQDNPDGMHIEPIVLERTGINYDDDGEIVSFDVELRGQAPSLEGWTLIAHTEWRPTAEENKVNAILNEDIPTWVRAEPPRCDHCETNRHRLYTYIVRRDETEDYKMVGTTCVGDYIGASDPHSLARYAELLTEAATAAAAYGDWYDEPQSSPWIGTHHYIATAIAVIDEYGWVSKTKAMGDPYARSTAERVAKVLAGNDDKIAGPSDADHEKAEAVIEWVRTEIGGREYHDRDGYEHNLYVALADDALHVRDCGLAASAPSAYWREVERKREQAEGAESEFVGDEGDRLTDLRMKLVFTTSFDSDYGKTMLYKFEDPDGNVLTWFTSSTFTLQKGDWYIGRGTVKGHEVYRGTKQTNLTRCMLIPEQFAYEAICPECEAVKPADYLRPTGDEFYLQRGSDYERWVHYGDDHVEDMEPIDR